MTSPIHFNGAQAQTFASFAHDWMYEARRAKRMGWRHRMEWYVTQARECWQLARKLNEP